MVSAVFFEFSLVKNTFCGGDYQKFLADPFPSIEIALSDVISFSPDSKSAQTQSLRSALRSQWPSG